MKPTQPALIPMPFAQNGNKNTIPENGTEGKGDASFALGFPQITETPLSIGGLPPSRKDFNGIFNLLSMFAFFGQSGGVFTYSKELNYVSPAIIWFNNALWICVKENGKDSTNGVQPPQANSQYWKSLADFLGVYPRSELDKIIKDLKDSVNQEIANVSGASAFSFLISKNGSVSFNAPFNVKKISCFVDTNFSKANDGGQSGENVVNVANVGNITMSASVTKSGSKGHYWGYSVTKSNAVDLVANIAKGSTIKITTNCSGSLDVESTSIMLVLS